VVATFQIIADAGTVVAPLVAGDGALRARVRDNLGDTHQPSDKHGSRDRTAQ